MSTTTSAAVLREFGAPLVIEELNLREPGPYEARVRITCAGVCHSDVGQANGDWDADLPLVLGHEGAGIVEAVGEGVDTPLGTRVLLDMAPGCGRCRHCAVGRPILCQPALDAMTGARLLTGGTPFSRDGQPVGTYALLGVFSGHVVVGARSLIPLPQDIPDEVGALLGCAVVTGVGAAIGSIDIQAGSSGAVIGVGGVGASAVQGARIRGATTIVAVDPVGDRRAFARRVGATDDVDTADEGVISRMRAAARHDGFDWTIVTVGSPAAMRLGVDLLRPGGTAAMVGLTRQDDLVGIDMLDVVTFEKRIIGSAYGTLSPSVLFPRLFDLVRSDLLRLDEFAPDRFPLERINDAFASSREVRGLRPVLFMKES